MPDLFVVIDVRGSESRACVFADSPGAAAIAASSELPTPYMYSDGTVPPRRLAVFRAEKVGEFEINAEEVQP